MTAATTTLVSALLTYLSFVHLFSPPTRDYGLSLFWLFPFRLPQVVWSVRPRAGRRTSFSCHQILRIHLLGFSFFFCVFKFAPVSADFGSLLCSALLYSLGMDGWLGSFFACLLGCLVWCDALQEWKFRGSFPLGLSLELELAEQDQKRAVRLSIREG